MKRLIKSRCSIEMNNDVQNYIIDNDNKFDNEYIKKAKLILAKILILPTNERVLRLSEDIMNGRFDDLPDINDNLDLWVARAKQLLRNKKILLSEKLYTFEEIKDIETKDNYEFFDDDPNFINSEFKLINISISEIDVPDLTDKEKEEITLYLDEGICDDLGIEQIGNLIEKIQDGIELSPIVITKNNYIIDGFHRYSAYLYLGIKNIKVFKEV